MLTKRLTKQLVLEEELLRQTGRTTKAVKKALELDAYFVCHNRSFARYLKQDYPELKIVSLSQYLDMDFKRGSSEHFWLGRRRSKVVFDHFVEYCLIRDALENVEGLLENETARKTHGLKADLGVGDYRG